VTFTTLAILIASYGIVTLGYSWLVLPWLTRRIDTGPIDGFLLTLIGGWLWVMHRPQWLGFEKVSTLMSDPIGGGSEQSPGAGSPEAQSSRAKSSGVRTTGAILVANHASGLDPFLLQVPIRRRIRWLMAQDQMLPSFAEAWRHLEVLPVTYGAGDSTTFREANRHLQSGGIIGIFPEGGIARPPRQVRPFLAGVGLMVARAKVPVIVCWIEGAPVTATATGAFFRRARVRVHCVEVVDFRGERDVEKITARLRGSIAQASGWPLNEEPMPWTAPNGDGGRSSSESGRGPAQGRVRSAG
jgi:1-acyl-sn-glycerol-3-phosphate acyltransferase